MPAKCQACVARIGTLTNGVGTPAIRSERAAIATRLRAAITATETATCQSSCAWECDPNLLGASAAVQAAGTIGGGARRRSILQSSRFLPATEVMRARSIGGSYSHRLSSSRGDLGMGLRLQQARASTERPGIHGLAPRPRAGSATSTLGPPDRRDVGGAGESHAVVLAIEVQPLGLPCRPGPSEATPPRSDLKLRSRRARWIRCLDM